MLQAGINPAFSEFQFHKGTIKPKTENGITIYVPNFNSIKVRLNHPHSFNCTTVTTFQFHKGTIKPKILSDVKPKYDRFQFHKGTIKPVPHPGRMGIVV